MKVKEIEPNTGIQFVMDDKGRKTAVLIDLKKHGVLWDSYEHGDECRSLVAAVL